jgi:hypothetical protein
MKPTLKAPGTKLLKLKYVKPLSKLAFKFKLRRYIKLYPLEEENLTRNALIAFDDFSNVAGRCSLTLSNPR